MAITYMLDINEALINLFPGSEIHGDPASDTKTTLKLAFNNNRISSIFSSS